MITCCRWKWGGSDRASVKCTASVRVNKKCGFSLVHLHVLPGQLSVPQVRLFAEGTV